ncbi:MAG: TIGR00297 family protein [Pseudanabaenaceae cyanobacterium bins.68]|nr:TIGR00297 family protein [Pseudanabaenaceae cyanobacterium bins.68]
MTPWLIAASLNTCLAAIAWVLPRKILTSAGIIHAWGLGILIWGCLSWQGYGVIFAYLILGSAVTRIGKSRKEAQGIAEQRDGARGPENLWGSALTAAICAIGFQLSPHPLWLLGYVASLSTKLADTTASEIGKAYGKTTFLITSFQPVAPGTEGAVSLEGTLAGIGGAVVLSAIGVGVGLIQADLSWVWCILAALIATNIESVIGATLQARWQWLTNEVVNGINTTLGAAIAVGLAIWLKA